MPRSYDTYAVVAPDGSVTFDFPGHVSASGIDMLSGTTASPPADRRIRWHQGNTKTGAVEGEVFVTNSGGSTAMFVQEHAKGVGQRGELWLTTDDDQTGATTGIHISIDDSFAGGTNFIQLLMDGISAPVLIDSLSRSGYAQRGDGLAAGTPPLNVVAPQGGWANYGAGNFTVGYRRGPDGLIVAQGLLKAPAVAASTNPTVVAAGGFPNPKEAAPYRFPTTISDNANFATWILGSTGYLQLINFGVALFTGDYLPVSFAYYA